MGGVITVVVNMKAGKVAQMFVMNAGNQGFRADAFILCAEHDGRAMGVVCADVVAFVAAQVLEAYPDVSLYVFNQMAKMDGAVGVRQGGGNQYFTCHDERCFINL